MRFRRAVQRYGRTPEPVTPYQRAGQVWDERIGSARVQARNGWAVEAVEAVIRQQASRAQRLAAADVVIFNDGIDLEELEQLVADLAARFGI